MTVDRDPAGGSRTEPNVVARALWLAGGFVSVGLGGLGIVVPGLPTTVFFIVAAWCFSHCSPRFERWVLGLPKIGPLVQDYRDGLGMPRRAKVIAVTMVWTAISLSSFVLRDRIGWVAVVVALGLVGTSVILWWVPTREKVLAARAAVRPSTVESPDPVSDDITR